MRWEWFRGAWESEIGQLACNVYIGQYRIEIQARLSTYRTRCSCFGYTDFICWASCQENLPPGLTSHISYTKYYSEADLELHNRNITRRLYQS